MIQFTRTGSGEPPVLLHALGTDRHMWDPVVEILAAEREVYAVDMPGFGASPPTSPAAPADLAAVVHAALGLDRPHVAGNSLGGWVALELALAGHARTVTAIAPAGLWLQPLLPRRSRARALPRRRGRRRRGWCAASAGRRRGPPARTAPPRAGP